MPASVPSFSYRITPVEVYGRSDWTSLLPADKVAIEFRPPDMGDVFLSATGKIEQAISHNFTNGPRIIVADRTVRRFAYIEVDRGNLIRRSDGTIRVITGSPQRVRSGEVFVRPLADEQNS